MTFLLPILIFSDFIAAYRFRREFDRETLNLIVPFAAIGIIIGVCLVEFNIMPEMLNLFVDSGGVDKSIEVLEGLK